MRDQHGLTTSRELVATGPLERLFDPIDSLFVCEALWLGEGQRHISRLHVLELLLHFDLLLCLALVVPRSGSERILVTSQTHVIRKLHIEVLSYGPEATNVLGRVNSGIHVDRAEEWRFVVAFSSRIE